MARILIATIPVLGHIAPFVPLAQALVARGHEVRWFTGAKYRARVEATGATFVGHTRARDYDDARLDEEFPERTRHRGLARLRFDLRWFIAAAPAQLADLRAIVATFPADIVLHDVAMVGAHFLFELGGPPTGALGITVLVTNSRDTAPFGLGLQPRPTALGRLRNRGLNWLVEHVAFRDVQACWNATRASVDLPPTGWWMDEMTRETFYLQPTVPGFEYPRTDLPSTVRFIGPLPPEQPIDAQLPEFWDELAGPRPVVHVTQGTIANTSPVLFAPAIEALAHEDVLVVIATGHRSVEELGLGRVADNVRVAPFIPYAHLLPRVSAMVTNGGYGGVQLALAHGVPLVVAGESEDKPEVAGRVAWSGVGVNLGTATPRPAVLREAVRAVLDDPRYRERARALAQEYRSHDAVARAIEIIETVARTGRTHGDDATAA
jgi:UDP:flavonoid glycosyltransferase YjiC (YdhE family)